MRLIDALGEEPYGDSDYEMGRRNHEFRGVAQGHEFDYQFCAYGERRTE